MDVLSAVRAAIARCGRELSLEADGTVYRFTACIQPEPPRAAENNGGRQTVFGRRDPRRFVYYGPPQDGGGQVVEGAVLDAGGERYEVLLWRDFFWRGQRAFRWAAVQRLEGEDADGSVQRAAK